MPRRATLLRAVATACVAIAIVAAVAGWPYVSSAALLFDLSGADSRLRRLVPVRVAPVQTEDVAVPTRHGPVPARLYHSHSASRPIVVVPGVHAGGVDEPRLNALSRRLAGAGATVLSVPLPDLRAYRITPAATDIVEDAVVWFAEHGPHRWARVGLIGVSFSGGLAIVAAGRPRLHGKLTAVVSLGGHGDLPRALRYLCTGERGDGQVRAPHDYGLAVMLLGAIPRLVPAPQVPPLERALTAFLDASSVVAADAARAEALMLESRAVSSTLEEPARSIMNWVYARDVAAAGRRLLPLVEDLGGDPSLSPERSPVPSAPVFLIHGLDDNVIPSSELPLLAAYLARQGAPRVRSLLTPLVSHADMQADTTWRDRWRLVNIWTAIWRELGR
jgi:dienelactone hydrolase